MKECREVKSLGIPSVILFGLPDKKDEVATGAWADDGIVQKATRAIKREVPGLMVIAIILAIVEFLLMSSPTVVA